MMAALAVWITGAACIAVTVGITEVGTWRRGVLGGLAWPSFPFLILASRLRYAMRRRSAP